MGKVLAVCVSQHKGTPKTNIERALLIADHGLEGDAHAGTGHRQVSLLANEKIQGFKTRAVSPVQSSVQSSMQSPVALSMQPSVQSSVASSMQPSVQSSVVPSVQPSVQSSVVSSVQPSMQPTMQPSEQAHFIDYGAFGENIVAEGIDFAALPVGTKLHIGKALLEITQIGKECHDHCAIYQRMGDCIMPREGVFAKVLAGGEVCVGDWVAVDIPYCAAVITVSDRSYAGLRSDESGRLAAQIITQHGYTFTGGSIVPDEPAAIETALIRLCDSGETDVIFTTGGTGFSPRDITPEVTLAVAERNAPGIAQAMLAHSLTLTDRAMFSRGVAVIRGRTLIINLPGSPKAVREILDFLLPSLPHGLDILTRRIGDCGRA